MKANKKWIVVFLLPTIALFLLIYAVPLIMVIFSSFFDYRLFPKRFDFVGFGNYVKMFTDPAFLKGLTNTLKWILIHCILHVGLGVILALVLYKKPRGWKFVRVTYMIPNIISNAAIGMIFLNIFNPSFGVLNSFLRMIGLEHLERNWLFETGTAFPSVTMIWVLFAGYTTTLVLAQALSVDESLIEAAQVDGATSFQIDRLIMLPLIKRMIGATVIMAATYMLQLFDLIYITTKGGPGLTTTNLALQLYTTSMVENNYGYASTIGVFIIIMGLVVITLINRVFGMNPSTRGEDS